MKIYWDWCDTIFDLMNKKIDFFLFINTVVFGFLGFLIWYILHFICLNNIEGLLCFVGYFAVLPGYMGGLIYFMRKD